MKLIWSQFELVLTAVGLALVIGLTLLITPPRVSHWKVAALISLIAGCSHGLIFWLLHRRQRAVRQTTINEMQMMLNDIINNQLTVIQAAAHSSDNTSAEAQAACATISKSVQTITVALKHISDESLRAWHGKYPHRSRIERN